MTAVDYKPIRLQLEKEYKRLNERLENLRSNHFSEEGRAGDPLGELEEAAESANLENLLAQEELIMGELANIGAALKKFTDGTYGLCEKCGRPITSARLQAMPTARLCMNDAQNRRQKVHALSSPGRASE